MWITTEPFANHSLVGFQPPSPRDSWYYSVEPISLMCLCWTHSGVFRINMIMIIRTGNSGTRQARASKLATEMYRLSGSALINGHLGQSRHLFSAGSNVPFCLLCSKSSRMAKLTSLALGLASFSQNWPGSLGGYKVRTWLALWLTVFHEIAWVKTRYTEHLLWPQMLEFFASVMGVGWGNWRKKWWKSWTDFPNPL